MPRRVRAAKSGKRQRSGRQKAAQIKHRRARRRAEVELRRKLAEHYGGDGD